MITEQRRVFLAKYPKMKVVFDTNVLISALITTGKPKELFQMAAERKIQLITSKEILKEFTEVADDPRIRKYVDQQDIIDFLKIIDTAAKITKVKSQFKAINEDPDDDVVLRTAVDGKADYIVLQETNTCFRREHSEANES